ncbi:MAG TPA: histidine--tRNA ligase [Solirubrobacteraceae bacterium]|nr:histidine--tRNA ligase [Solirubrobacteraceae bacterium]
MSERLQVPRGTYDVLPEEADARAALEATARRILEGAGYRRIETPTFEYTEVFSRGVGASTDIVQKEMYTFDDGGGRSVTLRPEGTAPICRAYVEHGMHKLPQPVKLWYLSSFFRSEKPQQGRFRQFWQVGAEAIGSDDPAVDAELIVLLATLLSELEVGRVRLRVSSLGTPAARRAYRDRLQAHLHANADRLSEDVRDRIELNPLRAFDSDHPGTRAVMADAPLLLEHLDRDDAEHFACVRELLDRAGVDYEVDPTLVRGLDYYTRTVFEFTSDALGAQSGVAGGGRYDGLVELLGGPPATGCGWAAGIERILLASPGVPAAAPPVDLYVAFDSPALRPAAFAVADEARRARLNVQVELAGRSRKGQLKHADRLGARYVALVGDAATVLKAMEGGEQLELPTDGVVARILRERGMR